MSKLIPDLGVKVCLNLFDSVKNICLFDTVIPWETMKTLCLYEKMFLMSHIG